MTEIIEPQQAEEPWLKITASPGFDRWLAERRVSLAFSTYHAGKLFLLGRNPRDELAVFERSFNRCMGLWSDGSSLWMGSRYQIWRLENALAPGEWYQDHDRVYIPRVGYTTGGVDAHDLACDANGRVIFANTRFSCLAALSERQSFTPLWKPSFINELTADDRCHLNGLAMDRGICRFVTVVGRTDTAGGWREHRQDGGCVLEVPSGRIVASGLSMPHSPRVHGGRLWLLNSGTGYFGFVDTEREEFVPLTFCSGYLRGLDFAGEHAVVGLSRPRKDKCFSGLALDENLAVRNTEAVCGLAVVELSTGDILHWVRIEGIVQELYDVVVLRDVVRPMAIGFQTDEIQRLLTIGPFGSL